MQKALAGCLIVVLVGWSAGGFFTQAAFAAQVSLLQALVSTSNPGVPADHQITFTSDNGVAEGQTLTITYETGFVLSALDAGDIEIATSTTLTSSSTCAGSHQVGISIVGQTITMQICTGDGGTIGSSTPVEIRIGLNTLSGNAQITNPLSIGSYQVSLAGTAGEVGETRIAIVEPVRVYAEVATQLDFQVLGVGAGTSTNGDLVLTSGTTTATSVPFGVLLPDTPKVLAHDLTVSTNAVNGFSVSVLADQTLTANNGADIDVFENGVATTTPVAWESPSGVSGDENTYGHWGVTSEDQTLTGGDVFGTALYVGNFVGTPRQVFYNDSAADGITAHVGRTRVGYKIETTVLQEAASDYIATLTYVVTPVF